MGSAVVGGYLVDQPVELGQFGVELAHLMLPQIGELNW